MFQYSVAEVLPYKLLYFLKHESKTKYLPQICPQLSLRQPFFSAYMLPWIHTSTANQNQNDFNIICTVSSFFNRKQISFFIKTFFSRIISLSLNLILLFRWNLVDAIFLLLGYSFIYCFVTAGVVLIKVLSCSVISILLMIHITSSTVQVLIIVFDLKQMLALKVWMVIT